MNAHTSEFERTFGRNAETTSNNANSGSNPKDRPKAQYWLNVGYEIDSTDKDGNPIVEFIALPTGIPLDTMDAVPANARDEYYQMKQQATNALREKVLTRAKTLAPGEEIVIGARGSLQIQIRRVKAEAPIVDQARNTLISDLAL